MVLKKSFSRFPVLLLFVVLISCIKDVDVDQARDIVIPPTAALDLIYFTIDSSHFHHQENNTLKAIDETRLEFLDDDYIRDGLVRADFYFRYTNRFSETVTNTIYFLSEANKVLYTVKFDIPAGTQEEPGVISYTEIIKEQNINSIRRSIKMRVELEMDDAAGYTEGDLQLKSRAFYQFEFK